MFGYGHAMEHYATFRGRASRAEFWRFLLVLIVLLFVGALIDLVLELPGRLPGGILNVVIVLAHVLPGLAVTSRRLHDTDWSGWWQVIGIIPLLGLVILIRACLRGTPGPNRFGPSPYGEVATGDTNLASTPDSVPSGRRDVIAEIERLVQLRKDGSLSEAEFTAMKAEALAQARAG